MLPSLKSSVDVSFTEGAGGSAATAHAETVGGTCVQDNVAVVDSDCRRLTPKLRSQLSTLYRGNIAPTCVLSLVSLLKWKK